jgi:hypothetical protein
VATTAPIPTAAAVTSGPDGAILPLELDIGPSRQPVGPAAQQTREAKAIATIFFVRRLPAEGLESEWDGRGISREIVMSISSTVGISAGAGRGCICGWLQVNIRGGVRLNRSGLGGMRQRTSRISGPYTGIASGCNDLIDIFCEFLWQVAHPSLGNANLGLNRLCPVHRVFFVMNGALASAALLRSEYGGCARSRH